MLISSENKMLKKVCKVQSQKLDVLPLNLKMTEWSAYNLHTSFIFKSVVILSLFMNVNAKL